MTVEEVYTNAFDNTSVAWSEAGNTPYLQNSDSDLISTNINNAVEANWTFPTSAGSGAINSVKIRIEAKKFEEIPEEGDYADARYDVYDGASWRGYYACNVIATAWGTWYEFDVSAFLNSWAKINAAKVRFKASILASAIIYIRRLTRKVDYTLAVAITETITAQSFPMLYLTKPVKAEELISKVEGATITKVAKDFPEELLKSGKAKELKSKWS